MKFKTLMILITAAGLVLVPGVTTAQQALKTDSAGNPVTPLNLGGGNVTGTLAAARLPAGIRAPVVQSITQAQGSVALAAGVDVAVLTVPLTGTLTLLLPAANSYPAGRLLAVIDPGGYSHANQPVIVQPSGGDLLNGAASGAGALTVLSGTGTASLSVDGASRWSAGQSYLRAPTSAGLTLAGPATTDDATALSVHDGNEQEIFFVRGDGLASALYFDALTALSSDAELIYSDGNGTLTADTLAASASIISFLDLQTVGTGAVAYPSSAARLYFTADGKLHARTPDHVDHVITWTTAP